MTNQSTSLMGNFLPEEFNTFIAIRDCYKSPIPCFANGFSTWIGKKVYSYSSQLPAATASALNRAADVPDYILNYGSSLIGASLNSDLRGKISEVICPITQPLISALTKWTTLGNPPSLSEASSKSINIVELIGPAALYHMISLKAIQHGQKALKPLPLLFKCIYAGKQTRHTRINAPFKVTKISIARPATLITQIGKESISAAAYAWLAYAIRLGMMETITEAADSNTAQHVLNILRLVSVASLLKDPIKNALSKLAPPKSHLELKKTNAIKASEIPLLEEYYNVTELLKELEKVKSDHHYIDLDLGNPPKQKQKQKRSKRLGKH